MRLGRRPRVPAETGPPTKLLIGQILVVVVACGRRGMSPEGGMSAVEKEKRPGHEARGAANDNGGKAAESLDPRISRIAEAIGRKLARDHIRQIRAANDNKEPGR